MIDVIVPDASVLLKLAFNSPDEGDKDNALAFLNAWLDGKVEILLPKLWSYEVGNVLMIKTPEMAYDLMEIFLGYHFNELDMTLDLCKETFNLMNKYHVTFYDAVYHAVAIMQKGTLLTADEAYSKKIRDQKHVLKLKDWNLR